MRFSITIQDIFKLAIFMFGISLVLKAFRDISWTALLVLSINSILVYILYSCRIYAVIILENTIEVKRLYQKNLYFNADNIKKIVIQEKFHPSKIEGFVIPFEIINKNGNEYSFNSIQFYDSKFSEQINLFCSKNSIEYLDENL